MDRSSQEASSEVSHLGSTTLWHEGLGARAPRPPWAGTGYADVVIIGGGFTGLWTALQLQEHAPELTIVVLEAHAIAAGASGRNGGFAMTLLDFDLHRFAASWGDAAAAHAHRAVARSVREIVATVEATGIDAEVAHTGLLRVATNPGQLRRIERDHATAERLGIEGSTLLDAHATRAELDSPSYLGGRTEPDCALVNPAKLAVGLADLAERRGVRIHEGTPVVDLAARPGGVVATTPRGQVHADTAVLATNAWTHRFPATRGWSAPLSTYIVVTEPLTEQQWAAIGWRSGQGVEDARNYVHYFRPTPDGRILWGGTDAVYRYGGPISPRRDRHEPIRRRLEAELMATFPQLGRVRFTHHWGGPIAVTSRFVPRIGSLDGGRVHYAFGYSGHGVAPTHTAGRILRDRILGRVTEDTEVCFVDTPQPRFPPEPLTWIGAESTRRLLQRQDRRMDRGADGGEVDPLLLRVLDRLS